MADQMPNDARGVRFPFRVGVVFYFKHMRMSCGRLSAALSSIGCCYGCFAQRPAKAQKEDRKMPIEGMMQFLVAMAQGRFRIVKRPEAVQDALPGQKDRTLQPF
jgi:hypothetical protein